MQNNITVSKTFGQEVANSVLNIITDSQEYYIIMDISEYYHIAIIPDTPELKKYFEDVENRKASLEELCDMFVKYKKKTGDAFPIGKIKGVVTFDSENY